jgi:putative hydrolase of the HAD superfamily
MSTPKAVLFDAGGTLVTMDPNRFGDLIEPILGVRPEADRMVQAHYHAMAAIADNQDVLAKGSEVWWPWWLSQFMQFAGLMPDPEAVQALVDNQGLWRWPLPGALEGVAAIIEAGYQVAIVSNADGTVAQDLKAAGFGDLFDIIIDSTVVGVAKPDPGIFTFALEALGVEAADTWYVGDSPLFDLGGAEAAGLAEFVLVDPFELHDGYRPRISRIDELPALLNA